MALILPGYSGIIWSAVKATLAYASANLNASNPVQAKVLAEAVAATLKNAGGAIATYTTYQGLQQLYVNLATLVPLDLNLPASTLDFLVNRVNAIQAAALSIVSILPVPGIAANLLASNNPTIADPMYLEWLLNFSFETTPSGLTAATLATQAQNDANAWAAIADALQHQSVAYSGAAYNTVVLMGYVAQSVANALANSTPSSAFTTSQLWNTMEAMPIITRTVSAVMNDPTSAVAQNTVVARYVIQQSLLQFNELISALREYVAPSVRLGTLRQGDTLMTLANRELGDYTLWRQIAQLNGLLPPYVAATPGLNVASPGQQLFLPTPNTTSTSAVGTSGSTAGGQQSNIGAVIASYINNYLGVDKYLGPLNVPMLAWTGDYQIISGYDNLQVSLGRRLQTTLSTLIYHYLYGSRIPPEVGQIESQNELSVIEQYAISCILSDPRVNKVVSCTATQGPGFSIALTAVALPNGLDQKDVTVNIVLGPP